MARRKSQRKMKMRRGKFPDRNGMAKKSLVQVEELLNMAEADINAFSYESAVKRCTEALVIKPNHLPAMEMLASVYMEMHDIKQAESLYLRCAELEPDEGYAKYLSLGQISEGKRSIDFYEKGISIIEKMIEKKGSDAQSAEASAKDENPSLERLLSDAFCSVAELYMTDLCDEEDAEIKCENAIQKSIKADDSNPESYLCLASLRVIQEKDEEAKSSIQKSISFWLPQLLDDDLGPENEHNIPEYENRIKAAQLLIEVKLYEEAIQVLERLLHDDDEVFVVWYLLGWTSYLQGETYREVAYHYLMKAKEIGEKAGCEQEELVEHVLALIDELKTYVQDDQNDMSDADDQLIVSSSDSEEEMEL